jgi:hypothetical protein
VALPAVLRLQLSDLPAGWMTGRGTLLGAFETRKFMDALLIQKENGTKKVDENNFLDFPLN